MMNRPRQDGTFLFLYPGQGRTARCPLRRQRLPFPAQASSARVFMPLPGATSLFQQAASYRFASAADRFLLPQRQEGTHPANLPSSLLPTELPPLHTCPARFTGARLPCPLRCGKTTHGPPFVQVPRPPLRSAHAALRASHPGGNSRENSGYGSGVLPATPPVSTSACGRSKNSAGRAPVFPRFSHEARAGLFAQQRRCPAPAPCHALPCASSHGPVCAGRSARFTVPRSLPYSSALARPHGPALPRAVRLCAALPLRPTPLPVRAVLRGRPPSCRPRRAGRAAPCPRT